MTSIILLYPFKRSAFTVTFKGVFVVKIIGISAARTFFITGYRTIGKKNKERKKLVMGFLSL